MRIYFSLKLVACENLFLSILFCGSLFLSWFFCEAEFYLYFAVAYAYDVPTCPIMYFFLRCSFEVMLKFVTFKMSSCVKMKEGMTVWYISTLSEWPRLVLAKNLPKGETVGYLSVGFVVAKTNSHV